MPKGAQAKAAKAAHQDDVKKGKAAKAESEEAAKWSEGAKGKGKGEDKAEKAAAQRAAKLERDRLLAEEEASNKPKPAAKPAPAKKAPPKSSAPVPSVSRPAAAPTGAADVDSFSASNLDDALDALDIVNEKNDKASVGQRAAKGVETHPERRFKAAFEAYKESELPELRKSHPGLRLQQYHDLLYKQFQKHPDNPFNQTTAAYDATKEDKVAAMAAKRAETEKRLRAD